MKKKPFGLLLVFALLICSFALAACGGDGSNAGGGVTSITITGRPTGDTLYFQDGTTFNLDFTYAPADKDVPDVEWTSSDESVATISTASGIKVRHRGIGDTTIKATVKNTTISDSFVLSIIEAPSAEITVDGVAVSVGFQAFGTGVDPAMATASEDKKEVTLDTGDVYSNGLGMWLFMPADNQLEKTQVYEVKVTAVVEDLSFDYGGNPASSLEVRTGAPMSATDDWARYCQWPAANNITGTGTFSFHGIFTTGDTDAAVAKWTVIKFNNVAPYSVSTKFTIKNIELKKVVPERARLQAQWNSTYSLSDFDNNATATCTRRFVTLDDGGNEQTGLGVALKTVFYSSDPETVLVTDRLNGKIRGLKEGFATLYAYIEGVYDSEAPAESNGFMTVAKEIQIINSEDVTATAKINGVNRAVALKATTRNTNGTSVDESMYSVDTNNVITFDTGRLWADAEASGDRTAAVLPSSPALSIKLPAPLELGEMYFVHFHYKMISMITLTNAGDTAAASAAAYNSQFGTNLNSSIVSNHNAVIRGGESSMERDRDCVLTTRADDDPSYLVLFLFNKFMDFKIEITDIEINKLDDTNCVVKINDGSDTITIGAPNSKNLKFSMKYIGEGESNNKTVNYTEADVGILGVFVTWTSSDTTKLAIEDNTSWKNAASKPCSDAISRMTGVAAGDSLLTMSFDKGSITTGAAGSVMSVTVTVS